MKEFEDLVKQVMPAIHQPNTAMEALRLKLTILVALKSI